MMETGGFKCPSQAKMISAAGILNMSFPYVQTKSNCGNGKMLNIYVKYK